MLCDKMMREEILSRLHGYRLQHTLGCEKAAIELAKQYGADVEKCAFGAILHDITKGFSDAEQLNLCQKYDIIPCNVEKKSAKILHGKTASKIACAEYNAPIDVANAIAYHTTGRENMTLIEKIIYLADFIEETRDFDGVEEARELSKINLDEALVYCFDFSINDLLARRLQIHPDTVSARNSLI